MPRLVSYIALVVLSTGSASFAARTVHDPVSDQDDGQLIDGATWDWGPIDATVPDLLLQLGNESGKNYDASFAYSLPELGEGATVNDVRLRFGEQGGEITSGLTLEISGALDLDPLASIGLARFSLPRTSAKILWSIPAAWDSSGQRIAKWEETPNLAPILNEIVAQPGWNTSAKVAALFVEVTTAIGDNVVRFDDTHGRFVGGGNKGMHPAQLIVNETFHDTFYGKELLCRPKPDGIQVNVVPHTDIDAFVEYGPDSSSFAWSTPIESVAGGNAHEFTLSGLSPDTRYFYRMSYRPAGAPAFTAGSAHSFTSLPLPGTPARICLTSDMHVTNSDALALDEHLDLLNISLIAMANYLTPQQYHLWLDLGDLVVIRAQRVAFDQEEVDQRYRLAREYIDTVGHSLPFVLARGNHEEVNGWDYDGTPNNTAVWSGLSLLKWFPPPLPDEFFEGNPTPHPDIGLPGNYYAFQVGNLRIRVLDPFLFSLTRPHNGHGETGGSLDGWDWQLGEEQYLWLHDELQQNPSLFSLLGLHHLTSCYVGSGLYYGRGGIEVAKYSVAARPTFEWGGEDSTGVNMLNTLRSGYLYGAIHDVLTSGGNQIVLKGHDHFYAKQELDGMIYLTMPRPDDTGQQTGHLFGWRYFTWYPEEQTIMQENSGFVSLLVDNTSANYSYVQTYPYPGMWSIRDSFTILAPPTGVEPVSSIDNRLTWIRSVVPNPARVSPRIEYELGAEGPVALAIYDAAGRLVRDLVNEVLPAGPHEAYWDNRDASGRRVASGVYFAQLRAGGRLDAVKMIVLK